MLRTEKGRGDVPLREFDRSVQVLWSPDGHAIAITYRYASGESTVWVHSGANLAMSVNLQKLLEDDPVLAVTFGTRRVVFAQRWIDGSTLEFAIGRPHTEPPVPMALFRYRLGSRPIRVIGLAP